MDLSKIRENFLEYFQKLSHTKVTSSSLIPHNDNTLLFTNAGMVQFKDVFTGNEKRDYKRATSSQKCIRAGGKHNDLENVGYTARHHTFFEMLGNFSFGDYFKREAIEYSWKFLTEVLKLDPKKLWVTVHKDDKEAEDIWINDIGVDKNRISRCGDKDNFWMMGDTGPCGPCSEIFFDHGEEVFGGPPGSKDEDGDRYVEIWNLVFMQYNRFPDGRTENLPNPSVDTGMGLERVAAVMQGVHNNYDIDLFQNLIQAARDIIPNVEKDNKSLRVIVDHLRSCSFLIADGILPDNEGRGYVLRRIMRRAIRHGYMLGMQESFFYKLVPALVKEMGDFFPQLKENEEKIGKEFLKEEERFSLTLKNGMKIFDSFLEENKTDTIPGDVLFTLYDTYGFPVDLTADLAKEKNLKVDLKGFDQCMEKQKSLAKNSNKFKNKNISISVDLDTEFLGYEKSSDSAVVKLLYDLNGKELDTLDNEGIVVLDQTPFYAESGGQVADTGYIESQHAKFFVKDVQKNGSSVLHFVDKVEGSIKKEESITAKINEEDRTSIALHHSATHLLHAALREVLGKHVVQKGSLVDKEKLRFDFSHEKAVSSSEINKIEEMVNKKIRENSNVLTEVMPIDKAKEKGAMSLFGEKYDNVVRVLTMGNGFSIELCGGTHVKNTGDIGLFKITSESAVASGIRRIEAVTGKMALEFLDKKQNMLSEISNMLSTSEDNLLEKVKQILQKNKSLENNISELNKKLGNLGVQDLLNNVIKIGEVNLIVSEVNISDKKELRNIIDNFKNQLKTAIIVLASITEDRASIFVGVTKDNISKIKAKDLVNFVAGQIGGKGGGRDDFAQAGGTEIENLKKALSSVQNYVADKIT